MERSPLCCAYSTSRWQRKTQVGGRGHLHMHHACGRCMLIWLHMHHACGRCMHIWLPPCFKPLLFKIAASPPPMTPNPDAPPSPPALGFVPAYDSKSHCPPHPLPPLLQALCPPTTSKSRCPLPPLLPLPQALCPFTTPHGMSRCPLPLTPLAPPAPGFVSPCPLTPCPPYPLPQALYPPTTPSPASTASSPRPSAIPRRSFRRVRATPCWHTWTRS